MNALITQAVKEGKVAILGEFPSELMNSFERDIIDWIVTYTKDYGKPPTLSRLRKQYPAFTPINSSDPLEDLQQQAVHNKKRLVTLEGLTEILAEMDEDESFDPASSVYGLSRKVSSDASGAVRYSTFDREEYFRPINQFKFHFPRLDKATGGLLDGDLAYIVGRLGIGKSTTAQWIVHHWWKDDLSVMFVSNEMLPVHIIMKLDAMQGKFNPLELRIRKFTKSLRSKVKVIGHIAAAAKGEVIIPKSRLQTPSQVLAAAAELEVDVVVVDGVHLMSSDYATHSTWERVKAVSNSLKQGALDLEKPILGVIQARRLGGAKIEDSEDIAYSDALGQDADTVIAVNPVDGDKDRKTLELIKTRFGPGRIGTQVLLNWESMELVDESAVT